MLTYEIKSTRMHVHRLTSTLNKHPHMHLYTMRTYTPSYIHSKINTCVYKLITYTRECALM